MSNLILGQRNPIAALVQGRRSHARALSLGARNPAAALVTAFTVNTATGHYFNSRFSDRFKK